MIPELMREQSVKARRNRQAAAVAQRDGQYASPDAPGSEDWFARNEATRSGVIDFCESNPWWRLLALALVMKPFCVSQARLLPARQLNSWLTYPSSYYG